MDLSNKGFQLPENIVFDSDSLTDTYGKFNAEPFERGYGETIGNSLRRVLISSIEGTAVTSIKPISYIRPKQIGAKYPVLIKWDLSLFKGDK